MDAGIPCRAQPGGKQQTRSGEDEDAEGRSESAQMFEEGVSEAEHDQMRQASEADEKSDEQEA